MNRHVKLWIHLQLLIKYKDRLVYSEFQKSNLDVTISWITVASHEQWGREPVAWKAENDKKYVVVASMTWVFIVKKRHLESLLTSSLSALASVPPHQGLGNSSPIPIWFIFNQFGHNHPYTVSRALGKAFEWSVTGYPSEDTAGWVSSAYWWKLDPYRYWITLRGE